MDPASAGASPSWRKSSYSESNGHCVEVAELDSRLIGVRDSQSPGGPVLVFGWGTLVGVRAADQE